MPLPTRIILSYFGAAVVAYAVQLFPFPGVIVMFLFAGFWVSLILNAMLIHLAFAAITKQIPRLWLLMPVLAYGAWFGFQGVEWVKTSRALESNNYVSSPIPADADLLFEKDDPFAVVAKEYLVGGRVFSGDYEIQIIQPHEPHLRTLAIAK
jgi:hypothetical protein